MEHELHLVVKVKPLRIECLNANEFYFVISIKKKKHFRVIELRLACLLKNAV